MIYALSVKLWQHNFTIGTVKYGDYEYATINSVVNKNFDSRFEVICLKIIGNLITAVWG